MAFLALGGERNETRRVLISGLLLSTGCSQEALVMSQPMMVQTEDAPLEGEPAPVDQDTAPGDRVIDPGGPMFSGAGFWASSSWWESASTAGHYGPGYFVAPTIESSDPAEYWWQEPEGGCRSIAAWWTSGSNRSERATYCLLYTSPSPRDRTRSRMPSSA